LSGPEGVEVGGLSGVPERRLALQDAISAGRHVLKLSGELDVATAPDLQAAVVRICSSRTRIVTLDLRKLAFMDSSGLAAIIAASKLCRNLAYEFRLIPGPPAVQRVFELTGVLDRLRFERAAAGASIARA
jgi:anti-sigma B factor antagonist